MEARLEPAANEADFSRPVDEPKELYVDLARLPGPGLEAAPSSCAAWPGLIGARIGWHPALLFLLYLVPVGVALAVVDWRTRYLPTRLIAPSYVVVGGAGPCWPRCSPRTGRRCARRRSAGSATFAVFFVLWFVTPAGSMAYGDVRLAGLLGMALGWLGLAQLVLGMLTALPAGRASAGSLLSLATGLPPPALAVRAVPVRRRLPRRRCSRSSC